MNRHAADLLDLPQLKEIVASHALCELGRAEVESLPVLMSRDEVLKEFARVAEMTQLLEVPDGLPLAGISDIRPLLKRLAVPNSYLQPEEYLQIFNFLSATANVRDSLDGSRSTYPSLHELTQVIVPMPSFKRMVRETFTPEGDVRDEASDKLKEIRQRKKELARRIDGALEKYLLDPQKKLFLQEGFITERNYRKVLPVKVECKGQIRGIIHAYSITEETAFIEPIEVVEMSNELTDIKVEEDREIRRILTEMGDYLREKLEPLKLNLDIASQLDGLLARARYGKERGCEIPDINDGGELGVDTGRHPLLMEKMGRRCIPLTLSLRQDNRALVISGPNAGGKTTAVKTVGILSLMVQSGIPIPAKKTSSFPVFSGHFADIGDEQSLAEGVSTFSSHIKQIKMIVEQAGERSLIILDELGTGTDPAEGSLLAQAILEELAQRSTMTLVTSHLTSLKTLDRAKPWARTASFSLDPNTERPNFILHMDIPGESNALKIAKMLGLSQKLIERAYGLMSPDERQLKTVIEEARKEQTRLEQLRKDAEEEQKQIVSSRQRYYRLIDELEVEKAKTQEMRLKQQKEVALERKRLLATARKDVERRIAGLSSRDEIVQAREDLAAEQEQTDQEIRDIEKKLERSAPKPGKPLKLSELQPGMRVQVRSLNSLGVVKTVYEGPETVDIDLDGLVFNVPAKDIFSSPSEPEEEEGSRKIHMRQVADTQSVTSTELNLIGRTVEVALEELDRFIDGALLSGFDSLRIIHGMGTGALRKAVRTHLKSHPRIESFREGTPQEGGPLAITVAQTR